LVDSNILIYIADSSDEVKHKLAINWLKKNLTTNLVVSSQNIREFANACLLKEILSAKELIEYINDFTSRFIVIQDDFLDTINAVSLCKGNQKLFWDASIVSLMQRKGINLILTENIKDFEALGVKAINPLK